MTQYTEIHHSAFSTGDMDMTIRYWRDLLGAELIYGYGASGQRQYFFRLSPQSHVAFFEWDGVEPRPPRHHGAPQQGAAGFDHLAIGVVSLEQLWDLSAALTAAGFAVSDVIDHGFIYSLYTHDPNGIALEFCCQRPGFDPVGVGLKFDQESSKVALAGRSQIKGEWPQSDPLTDDERVIVAGEGNDHFD